MKSSKLVIILTCLFLVACSSKSTSAPTNTPEPTLTLAPTQTPTNTPEPTPENTYCNPEEFTEAFSKMTYITGDLNDQVQLIIGDNPDHQSIITELTRIQKESSKIEVPECMEYLKELLDSAIANILEGETYAAVRNYTEATRLIILGTTDLNLYVDELDRLMECFPNCEP